MAKNQKEIEMTEVFKQLVPLCEEIIKYTSQENFSVRFVKEDLNALIGKKEQILVELKQAEQRIVDVGEECKAMIARAQVQADELIRIARENLAASTMTKNQADEELEKAQTDRYLAQKKLEELVTA